MPLPTTTTTKVPMPPAPKPHPSKAKADLRWEETLQAKRAEYLAHVREKIKKPDWAKWEEEFRAKVEMPARAKRAEKAWERVLDKSCKLIGGRTLKDIAGVSERLLRGLNISAREVEMDGEGDDDEEEGYEEEEDWDMALPVVVGDEKEEGDDEEEDEDVVVYDPKKRFAALGRGKKGPADI